MRIGIYPGSFDPITNGHLDIINRGSQIVDKLIVGVLNNDKKTPLFSVDERIEMLKQVTKDYKTVEIHTFSGLLIDFAYEQKANLIIRGIRAVTDFEYELQMAQTNYNLNSNIETIFLATNIQFSFLSSSIVKEVAKFGGHIENLVPPIVADYLEKKYSNI